MTTQSHHAKDGVHRLIDMVVEEVSLVDRAANKHRFLIVKRDDAMDDDNDNDISTPETSPSAAPTAKVDDGSTLGAALSALESLTGLVELLGSLGADQADARLGELARELRAVAEQLLSRAARSDGADGVAGRAKTESEPGVPEPGVPEQPSSFAENVTAAKQALAQLAELVARVPADEAGETAALAAGMPAPEAPADSAPGDAPSAIAPAPIASADSDPAGPAVLSAPEPAAPTTPAAPSVLESLSKLAESFRALSETVREQQQRLGRVEKQFGLPNSAAPAERVEQAPAEDVGWPLDLNKPKDRENVDKAVSFHDL